MDTNKIEFPVLNFGPDKQIIEDNRQKIQEFKKLLEAMLVAANGLNEANQAFCTHENKLAEYDPGYAGGGFSNFRCLICGSTEIY